MRKSLSDLPQGFYHKEEYPGLPEQLKQFNYYINDAGHSIMAIPNALIKKAHGSGELWNYEVPMPVKYVLEKGYILIDNDNYIVVEAEYNDILGVDIPGKYYEY